MILVLGLTLPVEIVFDRSGELSLRVAGISFPRAIGIGSSPRSALVPLIVVWTLACGLS